MRVGAYATPWQSVCGKCDGDVFSDREPFLAEKGTVLKEMEPSLVKKSLENVDIKHKYIYDYGITMF